jgi:phosphate transport system substrate-binding protein
LFVDFIKIIQVLFTFFLQFLNKGWLEFFKQKEGCMTRFLRVFTVAFATLSMLISFTLVSVAKDITVKGSDTMVILAQRWAEVYMKKNKNVVIQVTGGGSGTGIAALMNQTTDLANASRPIKPEEKAKIEAGGKKLIEIPVALDGIAVYVNNANPIKEMTISQLKDIFTGKISDWSAFGWDKRKIKVYSRENNSGTYLYFKEHVLGDADYGPLTQYMPGTASVLNAVKKDKYSIGYGGIGYLKGVRAMAIKKDENSPAYLPTEENVYKGLYPLSRFLYIYTTEDKLSDPDIKAYISWILSDEGQKVITDVGYYPLKKEQIKDVRKSIGL